MPSAKGCNYRLANIEIESSNLVHALLDFLPYIFTERLSKPSMEKWMSDQSKLVE